VTESTSSKTFLQRALDFVEYAGNKAPHPAILFLGLMALVIVLSCVLAFMGVGATYERIDFQTHKVESVTTHVRSLLAPEGIRFIATSVVPNFINFGPVGIILVAMIGSGVAERSGLIGALIRKIVRVAPPQAMTAIVVTLGVLSSIASDAGYLVLIPLGASAFFSLGRHPLAGLAAAFAGVAAAFGANVLIKPIDGILVEMANDAIHIVDPSRSIDITANFYFGIVSSILMALVAAVVTTKMIEPRLGPYDPSAGDGSGDTEDDVDHDAEARGLRYAKWGLVGVVVGVLAMTLPPGAPLRDAASGAIIGNTPFMASLIFVIALAFLICGYCYGKGAGTLTTSGEAIGAIGETYAGLGGLLLMFLMIAQFIAFFNYTNMPRVIAVQMAHLLERANVSGILLLVGLILVIVILNFILPGVVPKWAIFAPVFIPIFLRLDVAPQTVLAAYRVGDSPTNVLTPLMVYFPFIVTIARRYDKEAGIGSIIALMIPYAAIIMVAWIALFVVWIALGIPLGPGSPVHL